MRGDVERVARAMIAPLGHDPSKDWARVYVGNGFDTSEDASLRALCFDLARAAMAATREIDAEAMSNTLLPATWNRHDCADWLQQRANDVKEAGNG